MRIATAVWRAWLPWAWGAMAASGVVIGFLVAFGVAITADAWGLAAVLSDGPRLDLALLLLTWGSLSLSGVVAGGRLAFGRWLPATARTFAPPAAGLLLATALELTLHAWSRARFGSYDWDMVGWTAGLSFTLVLASVALFGVLLAPRGGSVPPLLVLVATATMTVLIALGNVGGALDGIAPESWPLATTVALSAAYAVGAVALAVRHVRRG